jgi:formylglycine-generating enzyme required for sulfatase activity
VDRIIRERAGVPFEEMESLSFEFSLGKAAMAIRHRAGEAALPLEVLTIAHRVGIIGPPRGSLPVFVHTLVQDYFLAKFLEGRIGQLASILPSDGTELKPWRDVLRILAGSLAPNGFQSLLEVVAAISADLAAECVSHRGSVVDVPAATQIVEKLRASTQQGNGLSIEKRIAAARSLGWTDPRIYPPNCGMEGFVKLAPSEDGRELWAELYPVTNLQFGAFLSAGGYQRKDLWSDHGRNWRFKRRIEAPLHWQELEFNGPNLPVVGVSLHEALAYCKWLNTESRDRERWHFSLPTDKEWTRMAFSPDPQRASDIRTSIIGLLPAILGLEKDVLLAKFERQIEGALSCFANDLESYREQLSVDEATPVGVFRPNAQGIYDMFCNVWQWCDSWISTRRGRPSTNPSVVEPVVVRGGPGENRHPVSLLLGGWFAADTRFERIGFRVCATPRRANQHLKMSMDRSNPLHFRKSPR